MPCELARFARLAEGLGSIAPATAGCVTTTAATGMTTGATVGTPTCGVPVRLRSMITDASGWLGAGGNGGSSRW